MKKQFEVVRIDVPTTAIIKKHITQKNEKLHITK